MDKVIYIYIERNVPQYNEINISHVRDIMDLDKNTDILFISQEEIAIFSQTHQQIVTTTIDGKIISKSYLPTFRPISESNDKNNSSNYIAQSYYTSTYLYVRGCFNFQVAYTDIFLKDKHSFFKYFSRKSQLIYRKDTNNNTYLNKRLNLFCNFPTNYRKGNFYGDFNSFRTEMNDTLIVSFPYSDTVFLFLDTILVKKECFSAKERSDFFSSDLNKTMDLAYQRKIKIEQPAYDALIYDSYQNNLFRVFKKASAYLNSNGEIKRETEIGWLLVLYDTNFKYINEYHMNPALYSSYRIYPMKKGLLVLNPIDSCLALKSIKYSLMKLPE